MRRIQHVLNKKNSSKTKQNKPKQRNIPFWDTGIQSVILKIFSKVTSKCWESNFELWICEVIWWKLNIFLQNNIGKHSCWLSAVLNGWTPIESCHPTTEIRHPTSGHTDHCDVHDRMWTISSPLCQQVLAGKCHSLTLKLSICWNKLLYFSLLR